MSYSFDLILISSSSFSWLIFAKNYECRGSPHVFNLLLGDTICSKYNFEGDP